MPRAACTARRGLSSWAMGAPNRAITPSPVYWLMVPSKRCTSAVMSAKAVIHDLVHHFGIEVPGQGREAGRIGEQHRDLLAFPFQSTAGGENLLGEMRRRVREQFPALSGQGKATAAGAAGDRRGAVVPGFPVQTRIVRS